jgi:hypothetical protein
VLPQHWQALDFTWPAAIYQQRLDVSAVFKAVAFTLQELADCKLERFAAAAPAAVLAATGLLVAAAQTAPSASPETLLVTIQQQ